MSRTAVFRIPDLKRVVKAAHKLQLSVDDLEISPSGEIRVHIRSYTVDADGRVLTRAGEHEDPNLQTSGEAA